jgi:hypothetical protein
MSYAKCLKETVAPRLGECRRIAWSTSVLGVTDETGLSQPACPKEWKKYEEGMNSNINVM